MLTQHHYDIHEQDDGSLVFSYNAPLTLTSGNVLDSLVLRYETFGTLSADKQNVILINHALSTGPHITSHEKNQTPGWWEETVGPGKPIDTDRFFVISIANLGSCMGSSGPASMNPHTHKLYRTDFPNISIEDMVHSQHLLIDALGIKTLHAVIGNSMGAMLSLTWAVHYPHIVERLVSVSSAYKAYPVNIAYRSIQREIIRADPHWQEGHYKEAALPGMKLARKLGHLSYRNPEELNARFDPAHEILNYLDYNAEKFTGRFDPNCYLYLTEAMDQFDITRDYPDENIPFQSIRADTLVISVNSDFLFTPLQQKELYDQLNEAGVTARFVMHESNYGHDAFYADTTISHEIERFLMGKQPNC